MLSLFLRFLLPAGLGFSLLACSLVADHDSTPLAVDREASAVVALQVEVELSIGLIDLGERPVRIVSADVDDESGLELSNFRVAASSVLLSVRGKRVGNYRVTIEFEGRDGLRHSATLIVEVVAVHHSTFRVDCSRDIQVSSYAIPSGAVFSFEVLGFSEDGTFLASGGQLPLVTDFDGFEAVEGQPDRRVAPDEPGRYMWKLEGEQRQEVEFVVYDRGQLDVSMQTKEDPSIVEVTTMVAQQPACLQPDSPFVDAVVSEGDCSIRVGQLDLADGQTLDLGSGQATFRVAGEGGCTVSAWVNEEERGSLTLELQEPPPGAGPAGFELSPEESELSLRIAPPDPQPGPLDCGRELPQPECDWQLDPSCEGPQWSFKTAGGADLTPSQPFGAGLDTVITIGLTMANQPIRPLALGLESPVVLDGPELTYFDCKNGIPAYNLATPTVGEVELAFSASNAPELGELRVVTREVARANLVARTPVDVSRPPGDAGSSFVAPSAEVQVFEEGSTRHYFVAGAHSFALEHQDGEGQSLLGVGSVRAAGHDTTSARLERPGNSSVFHLHWGQTKGRIELGSTQAPSQHTIFVEEEPGAIEVTGDSGVLSLSEERCVGIVPRASDGLVIGGAWPTRPKLSGARGRLSVSEAEGQPELTCFSPLRRGTIELTWTWGSATEQTSWTVE